MSSSSFLPSILFTLFLVIPAISAAAKPFTPRAVFLPVVKDPSTTQYITTIFQRNPLHSLRVAVDIGGKALWVACDKKEYRSNTYSPAICHSQLCKLAKSTSCGNCWDGPYPGCMNNTCNNVVYNTFEKAAQIGDLGTDILVLQSTDGSNPGRIVRVWLFVGNAPYTFLPGVTVSERLTYTPLVVNPVTTVQPTIDDFPDKSWPSMEYFIDVESIKVNGEAVAVSPNLLKINKKGNGGTKMSTVEPYTVLHSKVYNAITKAFVKAIAKVPRVGAVAPFGTCYKAASLGSTRLGAGVPAIELGLRGGGSWSIFGANSMVYVNGSEVACLGFVDGGKKARTAIVIGGHQMEDNLLEFDLEKGRLGISNTLLGRQTTCANFNFTNKA